MGRPTPTTTTVAVAAEGRALCARHTAPRRRRRRSLCAKHTVPPPLATDVVCFAHSPTAVGGEGSWVEHTALPATGGRGCELGLQPFYVFKQKKIKKIEVNKNFDFVYMSF